MTNLATTGLRTAQIGIDNIIYLVFFMVFMLFYQRLMVMQMLLKLEQSAMKMEEMAKKTKNTVLRKISIRPDYKLQISLTNFLETVAIMPKSLDPYGLVPKIDHIRKMYKEKFEYFADRVAGKMEKEEKANLIGGLSGAITMNYIAKVVRHFVEMVRETKNLQLAMMLQMQLPEIEKLAKSVVDGTEALTNGWPVGDGAGPMVASLMIGSSKISKAYDMEEMILVKKKIRRRNVIIMRAMGPGGRIGELGDSVVSVVRKNRIAKIITIDAAAKLKGEKTGSVADAVGVAIGGIGTDSFVIEEIAIKKKIPLEAYAIKINQKKTIQPVLPSVITATREVVRRVEENVAETKEKGTILIVGVGNCSGISNTPAAVADAEKLAKKVQHIVTERKKKEKKNRLAWLMGG
jgi:hypothetical protein